MRANAIAVLIAATVAQAAARGAVIHVNWAGGGDYTAIGPAVSEAAEGDTVLVAPGTYAGPANRQIMLTSKNVVLRSEAGASNTVIDCEYADLAVGIWAPGFGVVDTTTVIEGFTFRHGFNAGGGGAIECSQAEPVVRACVFEGNHGESGGAVKLVFSGARIRDCVFKDNWADYGGAILFTTTGSPDVTPRIELCLFYGNCASTSGGPSAATRAGQSFATARSCGAPPRRARGSRSTALRTGP